MASALAAGVVSEFLPPCSWRRVVADSEVQHPTFEYLLRVVPRFIHAVDELQHRSEDRALS